MARSFLPALLVFTDLTDEFEQRIVEQWPDRVLEVIAIDRVDFRRDLQRQRLLGTTQGVAPRPRATSLPSSYGDGDPLRATVLRQVFLGSSRDYMVEVADGTQIRVVAPPAENMEPGSSVWLHLPPESCRVLSG